MKFRLYPSLLILVTLIHLWLLFLNYNFQSHLMRHALDDEERPIKVKILNRPEELRKKSQIVQSDESDNDKVSEDAFLSDKNRSFDRQSRSRKVDSFKKAAQGGRTEGKQGSPSESMKLSDLGAMAGQKHPLENAAKMAREGKSFKPGIKQSEINTSDVVSSTNDYLEEVPLGDTTYLNTAEYKYYGFYHRIRQRLEQFWGRSIQEKAEMLVKGGRRLPASDEHLTSLQITLDDQGEIIGIRVMGTSGVKELDDAAIESFNDAGPFPNPPKDLIVDGKVTLEWGFVVQT